MKGFWFAYAMMWIAVSVAVCVGIYFTRSIHCLWFLFVPSFVSLKSRGDEANTEDSEERE